MKNTLDENDLVQMVINGQSKNYVVRTKPSENSILLKAILKSDDDIEIYLYAMVKGECLDENDIKQVKQNI